MLSLGMDTLTSEMREVLRPIAEGMYREKWVPAPMTRADKIIFFTSLTLAVAAFLIYR